MSLGLLTAGCGADPEPPDAVVLDEAAPGPAGADLDSPADTLTPDDTAPGNPPEATADADPRNTDPDGNADPGNAGPDGNTPAAAGDDAADAGTGGASPWRMGTLTGDFEGTAGITERPMPGTGTALLEDVRTGRHERFDRVVFEFEHDVPGYHIEYIDAPVRACGSGKTVALQGQGWLQVRFSPAQAHTQAGEPTVPFTERFRNYPVLQELEQTCDFEGNVTWVLGLDAPNRYRAQVFQSPPRLVLDVRH